MGSQLEGLKDEEIKSLLSEFGLSVEPFNREAAIKLLEGKCDECEKKKLPSRLVVNYKISGNNNPVVATTLTEQKPCLPCEAMKKAAKAS